MQRIAVIDPSAAQTAIDSNAIPDHPVLADVVFPLRLPGRFTYRVPLNLVSDVRIGSRLLVSLGRTPMTCYVVELRSGPGLIEQFSRDGVELKDVDALLDAEPLLTEEVMSLTYWVADYYASPWGSVLKAALPAGLNAKIEQILTITESGVQYLRKGESPQTNRRETIRDRALVLIAEKSSLSLKQLASEIGKRQASKAVNDLEEKGLITFVHKAQTITARAKKRKAIRLLSPDPEVDSKAGRALTPKQQGVLNVLNDAGGEMALNDLLERAAVGPSTINTLEKRGLVQSFERDERRDPLAGAVLPDVDGIELNSDQAIALQEIELKLKSGGYSPFLLHGVTSSGKTEIYIRAMRAALALGKSALMLVPEIALTPVFSRRLRAHFGDFVAILHSSLTPGERFDEWSRIKRGQARIVIGTRSAVFAPVTNLGLIVVDEEHETSYRQHEPPYYHGRDTAIVRAQRASAVVVLGSATPSLESFHNAKTGKYQYLRLPTRIGDRPMAQAELIDMRKTFEIKKRAEVFSEELLAAIDETHRRGEQSMIMLNRRGYSSFVLCRSCGESIHCPNCDVTLTYHRGEGCLVCHYCNHRKPAPRLCPTCNGKFIYYVGEGTEQIEALLRDRFPELRIARVDRDTAGRRKLFESTILAFESGDLDMLVGTQMLAKGHDFPRVTLVGVVSVDAGLAMPDFRSAERTFQLITQVAGRAGRGDRAGRVLIQTYYPTHYALQHAARQDYAGFYDEEIRYRRSLHYPPFVALASLLVHDTNLKEASDAATAIRREFDKANTARSCRVLGPAPAPIARIKGENRIQILVKSNSRIRLREVIDAGLESVEGLGLNQNVDLEIDPVTLM